ncbi:MAG: sulfatase-like hydrolase/transferase [Bryobacterales bacterium]
MNRREFLALAGGAALTACTEKTPAPTAEQRPPNIVFIMADDLGPNHLGSYGGTEIRTPRLDELAKQSLRFTEAYSGCTVCAPARSTLMTGLHTGHTPVRGNSGGLSLPSPVTTVAETLKSAGYATGIFGKWGLGEAGTEGTPDKQGFDESLGPLHQIHAQYYYPEFLWKNGSPLPLPENQNGQKGRYAPDVMLGGALEFLRAHAEEPFFLYFPSIVPHHEFQVPDENFKEYAGRYEEKPFIREDRGFEVQEQPAAAFAGMVTRFDGDVGKLTRRARPPRNCRQHGRLFHIRQRPCRLRADRQGFPRRRRLRGYKTDLYEGGIRTPMLVRWPGKIQPGVSDFPVGVLGLSADGCRAAARWQAARGPRRHVGRADAARPGSTAAHRVPLYWESELSARLHQAERANGRVESSARGRSARSNSTTAL